MNKYNKSRTVERGAERRRERPQLAALLGGRWLPDFIF